MKIWKKKFTAKEAALGYIEHIIGVHQRNFEPWIRELTQAAAALRADPDEIETLVKSKNGKLLHFAALCALDALAIPNCFPPRTATTIYNNIRNELRSRFGAELDWISDLIFEMMKRARRELEERNNLPNDTIAHMLMELMDFPDNSSAKPLYDSVLFMPAMSMPLVEGIGWWKTFSENATIRD